MRGLLPGSGNNVGDIVRDKKQPLWLRIASGAIYLFAQIYFIALMLTNHGWFEKSGREALVVVGAVLNVLISGTLIVLGVQAFRDEARNEGRTFLGALLHALRGTFLFLLLPCLLVAALLVAWGILTHQPAFR